MINQYRILIAVVFYSVAIIISGQIIRLLGIRKGVIISIFILIGLSIYMVLFFNKEVPSVNNIAEIKLLAESVKGFVIASALIGCIIGGAVAGFVAKSLGRKNGLVIATIAFTISVFSAW